MVGLCWGGGSSSSLPGCRCRWRKEGLETSQGSLISPTLPGLLGTAELPGLLACWETLGALGSFCCPLLLGNRGIHANGRDQSPSFRPGTRGVGGPVGRGRMPVPGQLSGPHWPPLGLGFTWVLSGMFLCVPWAGSWCTWPWYLAQSMVKGGTS